MFFFKSGCAVWSFWWGIILKQHSRLKTWKCSSFQKIYAPNKPIQFLSIPTNSHIQHEPFQRWWGNLDVMRKCLFCFTKSPTSTQQLFLYVSLPSLGVEQFSFIDKVLKTHLNRHRISQSENSAVDLAAVSGLKIMGPFSSSCFSCSESVELLQQTPLMVLDINLQDI